MVLNNGFNLLSAINGMLPYFGDTYTIKSSKGV